MNLIEELLKENKSFTKEAKKKKVVKEAKKKNNVRKIVKEGASVRSVEEILDYLSSFGSQFIIITGVFDLDHYIDKNGNEVPRDRRQRDLGAPVLTINDVKRIMTSNKKYGYGHGDQLGSITDEDDKSVVYWNDPYEIIVRCVNSSVVKESKSRKSVKELFNKSDINFSPSISVGDIGSGNKVDAEVDADVKDSSFGAGGTGGDVIKKKDEEECLKESKEVDEDVINQLVVGLFDKLGLDIYDTDPDIRFDELVYTIYEIYQDHKHNVREGILNKALDVIKDPAKSGIGTLLGDKEEKEELLKEGYSDNHIELKFKSGSTLDDDTYDRLFDITANGVAIEPSDDYEPGTPLPWDASIDIEGNKAIINGSLGPGGVDTDCNCEITLPVTKVNKYYNVYVDANEEDYDEVVDLLTKCNLV